MSLRKRGIISAAALIAVIIPVLLAHASSMAPSNPFFQRTWERTDHPVKEGAIDRTWMWGPGANTGSIDEPYKESPGGLREVQYYDKSRMEINLTGEPQDSVWYVTNGLLVVEMVTGQRQIGEDTWQPHLAATNNVAGDPNGQSGPTYAALDDLRDAVPDRGNALITEVIDKHGDVGENASLASENVRTAHFDVVTGHNVAGPFWEFMTSSGMVYEGGAYVDGDLFLNPIYATGRPITEAYWAYVPVDGINQWVLLQAFERRVLTYTPGNPDGWKVEAGNVGQHYFEWSYGYPVDQWPGGPGTAIELPPFAQAGPQGLGDRQDSWPWSMEWWQGDLYVGTNRAYRCVSLWSTHKFVRELLPGLGDLFPYPGTDPDMACTDEPQDLPMQAEIWRWSPENSTWTRVFQSPNDVPNPDHPGHFLPRDSGFRSMTVHVEADGTEALYVAGINTRPMWDGEVPPPRILRSTDGVTFEPVPQDPGTFMGNIDSASFRSLTSFDGQLFVLLSSIHGNGVILGSTNPAAGNNAWRQVSPEPLRFFELGVFNGALFAGEFSPPAAGTDGSYSVIKTYAQGLPPYEFQTVVPQGGFLSENPSKSVVSMFEHNGRLFVGTDKPSEILRINPDDTWDLVVGEPRLTPTGMKFPISGIDEGFADHFNEHIWRLESYRGQLYAGTYHSGSVWKENALVAPRIEHNMGFDLYRTGDNGWYFTPETTNGFGDPFSIGVRTFEGTPYGLFLGAANDYHGMVIWRRGHPDDVAQWATTHVQTRIPARLEAEIHQNMPVLSWEAATGAESYIVKRAEILSINLPLLPWGWPPPSTEVSNLEDPTALELLESGFDANGLMSTRSYPSEYVEIAETTETTWVDETTEVGKRYVYLVMAKRADGTRSGNSNLAQAPSFLPPVTFTNLQTTLGGMEIVGRFASSESAAEVQQILEATQSLVDSGNYDQAIAELKLYKPTIHANVIAPYDTDVEILIAKLIRRLELAEQGLINPSTLH